MSDAAGLVVLAVIALGGVLTMVGFFASVGSGLRYSITAPLFSF